MEFNTWCLRLTAAMILSELAVQVKGLGFWLCSARKRLIAAWRPTTGVQDASLETNGIDSFAKKPSTASSHEREVGVKCKVKR